MIIDDSQTSREILHTMLSELGYSVSTAERGETALQQLAQQPDVELIVLDWRMPEMDGIETARQIHQQYAPHTPPHIIMITAFGRDEAIASSHDVHIDAYITKPILRSALLHAIATANGMHTPQAAQEPGRNKLLEHALQQLQGAHILLVEDNDINQELAAELLTSNGLTVALANNGQQALDMLEQQTFDGVLMDCQMPVMDGYEATRRLRMDARFEALPILAMTANAMAGDREKVLAAGMNEHISKPVELADMFTRMAQWIHPATSANDTLTPLATTQPDRAAVGMPVLAGIDTQAGLLTCQGNQALYEKLLRKFAAGQRQSAAHITTHLAQHDTESALRDAHTLKGVAGNIGARALQNSTQQLEHAIRQQTASLPALLNQVSQQLEQICQSIDQQLTSAAPAAPVATLSTDQLQAQLRTLRTLLQQDDTDAQEQFEPLQHALSYQPALTTQLNAIAQSVQGYDFENALAQLDALENALQTDTVGS